MDYRLLAGRMASCLAQSQATTQSTARWDAFLRAVSFGDHSGEWTMARLTSAEAEALKEQLLARRAELLAEIRDKLAESRAHTGTGEIVQWSETGDQALATLIASTDFEIARRDIEAVREVDASLRSIAAGEYGHCVDCGRSVGFNRLQAYPTATRCTDCQGHFERRRGHGRGASL